MKERYKLFLILAVFVLCYFFPLGIIPEGNPFYESLALVKWYAQAHVILCLVPAFFIAGAISIFIRKGAVIKYLGAQAKKVVAYSVAAVSGTILAVCSCTVLPLFSGIHKKGAGLGPAIAFLYSGPAINVLAIILTARILGAELGFARAAGAIVFSVVIGLLMHLIFIKEERKRANDSKFNAGAEEKLDRPLWKTAIYFALMVAILVFANWAPPQEGDAAIWTALFQMKWYITGVSLAGLGIIIWRWFEKDELTEWVSATWVFSKQILPLLFIGVLVAGFLLGRPGKEGLIPSQFIANLVGGNSIFANFFSSIVGAFMYFATLTEVPILQGLIGSGMGKGPALALLLAGPALSLPNMLVIRSVIGTKKTLAYIGLVVVMATISGLIFGVIV